MIAALFENEKNAYRLMIEAVRPTINNTINQPKPSSVDQRKGVDLFKRLAPQLQSKGYKIKEKGNGVFQISSNGKSMELDAKQYNPQTGFNIQYKASNFIKYTGLIITAAVLTRFIQLALAGTTPTSTLIAMGVGLLGRGVTTRNQFKQKDDTWLSKYQTADLGLHTDPKALKALNYSSSTSSYGVS